MTRTLILFAVGSVVLFFFESTFTLAAGVLLLLASIVSGVFTVANPEFLGEGD